MFALFLRSGTATIWKDNYCTADFTRCSRYQLSQQGKSVPSKLLPNGKSLKIIK
jgi:hypothetical protein